MDLKKFNIFRTGMTEDELENERKSAEVNNIFEREKEKVVSTMNSKGFKIIIDKLVSEIETAKMKLIYCSEKELPKLQLEIKIRKEFLDLWSPYAG